MEIVEELLQAMRQQIEKHGLELMSRYPNDLLVHDRFVLERMSAPGAIIAWMVGHCHTHIVPLGLHPQENDTVTYLTNLAEEDRFYRIRIQEKGFTLTEVGRDAFGKLNATAVPYHREGVTGNFWLLRGKERLGHVRVDRAGGIQDLTYRVEITPVAGISRLDRSALEHWAGRAQVEAAHSLFVRGEILWAEPVREAA